MRYEGHVQARIFLVAPPKIQDRFSHSLYHIKPHISTGFQVDVPHVHLLLLQSLLLGSVLPQAASKGSPMPAASPEKVDEEAMSGLMDLSAESMSNQR